MEIIKVGDLERFELVTCLAKNLTFCKTKYVATCAVNFIKEFDKDDYRINPVDQTIQR